MKSGTLTRSQLELMRQVSVENYLAQQVEAEGA